jgi:molybdopterin-synthase adenylyltransferase
MSRVCVNPAFPLYVDDERAQARLGDLPATGQILHDADEPLRKLVRACAGQPRGRSDLQELLGREYDIPGGDIDAAIEALLETRFFVRESDLRALSDDKRLMRQALFFSMYQPADAVAGMLDALSRCTVVVLGAGGIGGAVATQLVTAGVRKMRIVDDDRVEVSNLHRQHLYATADVGIAKVTAAARRLRDHSPLLEVETVQRRLRCVADIADVIDGAGFVVSAVDRPVVHIRRWVNQACMEAKVPFAFGGFSEHLGIIGPLVIPGTTGCLACQDAKDAERHGGTVPIPDNADRVNPAFGPLCAIVAGMLSSDVVRHITGVTPPTLAGRFAWFDLMEMTLTTHEVIPRAGCTVCANAGPR